MHDPTNSKYRYLNFKSDSQYRRYRQDENDKSLKKNELLFNDSDIPAHGTYGALLFDPRWKIRREEILSRDNASCVICRGQHKLQVHHRQYHFIVRTRQFKLPWEYDNFLLITLCESCHKRGHSKYKVPTINI